MPATKTNLYQVTQPEFLEIAVVSKDGYHVLVSPGMYSSYTGRILSEREFQDMEPTLKPVSMRQATTLWGKEQAKAIRTEGKDLIAFCIAVDNDPGPDEPVICLSPEEQIAALREQKALLCNSAMMNGWVRWEEEECSQIDQEIEKLTTLLTRAA